MQKFVAASFAALLGMGGAATAADVYSSGGSKDAPIYVPVSSWTGFYFGVNGGYGWSGDHNLTVEACEIYCYSTYQASKKISSEGPFGGGQIGYNWQAGSLVFGIETDLQGAGISGNGSVNVLDGDYTLASGSAKSELDWFGTVRGRIGYLVAPQALVYFTGGFAYGGVKDTLSLTSPFFGPFGSFTASKEGTKTGYVLGGGLEYKINPSWSLKGEYQYIDLGTDKLSATDYCGFATTSFKADHTYNTVRLGLNYHLGVGPAYEPLK
jgi:outer membrane immunogenic protein